MSSACAITDEVKAAIANLQQLGERTVSLQPVVILKCSKADMQLKVEDEMKDCSLESLREEMDPSNPRIIVYRYGVKLDAVKTQMHNCIIFYNPGDYAVELKRIYELSFQKLVAAVQPPMKSFTLTDAKDLKDSIVSANIVGLRGKMGDPVV